MSRTVDRLEGMLDRLEAQFETALVDSDGRQAATLTTAILKVAESLQAAELADENSGATLDRSPRDVARWLEEHRDAIQRLAE